MTTATEASAIIAFSFVVRCLHDYIWYIYYIDITFMQKLLWDTCKKPIVKNYIPMVGASKTQHAMPWHDIADPFTKQIKKITDGFLIRPSRSR